MKFLKYIFSICLIVFSFNIFAEKNVKVNSFLIAEVNEMGSALYIMIYNKYDYPPFDYIDYSSPDVEDIINGNPVKEFIRLMYEMKKKYIKVVSYVRDETKIKIVYANGDTIEWFFYSDKEPVYLKKIPPSRTSSKPN